MKLVTLLRFCLGAGFLWAGVSKLHGHAELAASIASFRLLPAAWIPTLADSLPFFEALIGCWLLLGWRPRAPALAATLLTAVFVIAALQAAARELNVNCACFGPTSRASLAWIITRDLLWLTAAGSLLALVRRPHDQESSPRTA